MARTNMLAGSVQEPGLAAWFGRSLIGGLEDTNRAGNGHWSRSAPVTLAAIGAYLSGSYVVMTGNTSLQQTLPRQRSENPCRALMATACTRLFEGRVIGAGSAVAPQGTWPEPAGAGRSSRKLRRSTVVLTGALVVFDAVMSEMQRPLHVTSGVVRRFVPGRR